MGGALGYGRHACPSDVYAEDPFQVVAQPQWELAPIEVEGLVGTHLVSPAQRLGSFFPSRRIDFVIRECSGNKSLCWGVELVSRRT